MLEFEDLSDHGPNPIESFQLWMDELEAMVLTKLNEDLIQIDPSCEGPYYEWYNEGRSPLEFFNQFFNENSSL